MNARIAASLLWRIAYQSFAILWAMAGYIPIIELLNAWIPSYPWSNVAIGVLLWFIGILLLFSVQALFQE